MSTLVDTTASAFDFLRSTRLSWRVRRWLADAVGRPIAVILGVNPLADGGGGKRPAMFARELVRRGYAVLHLFVFPRGESVDLALTTPREILELDARKHNLDWLIDRVTSTSSRPWVLVEVPTPRHVELAARLRSRGARIVYDSIDAWQGSLGAGWYDERIEDRFAQEADALIGSAAPLLERLHTRTRRRGTLVPNAVDDALFDPDANYPRPVELPAHGPIVLYTGALWGDWMDWSLVRRLAEALPQATIAMVGDYRGELTSAPRNLCFTGLRPHAQMPAFVAHSDVAILPWRVDVTTLGTSPLKVYEYLAMRRAVVAPDLPALRDLDDVTRARDADAFIEAVRIARPDRPRATSDKIRREHCWRARVDLLTSLL